MSLSINSNTEYKFTIKAAPEVLFERVKHIPTAKVQKNRIYGVSNTKALHSSVTGRSYFERDGWSKTRPEFCLSGDQEADKLLRHNNPMLGEASQAVLNAKIERHRVFRYKESRIAACERERDAVHSLNELLQYQFSGGKPPTIAQ